MATIFFVLNRFQIKFKSYIRSLNTISIYRLFTLKLSRWFSLKSNTFIQQQILFPLSLHIFNRNKFQFLNKKNLNCKIAANTVTAFSSNSSENQDKYIPLMNFKEIFWPGIFKHIENMLLLNFIMNLRFDENFSGDKFLYEARNNVCKVSKYLSKGELEKLEGVVTDSALEEIKKNLSLMSEKQREGLHVKREDSYLSFVYTFNVEIIENKSGEKRFVEIVCVYHFIKEFEKLKKAKSIGYGNGFTFTNVLENRDLVSICNYSFIREFTPGTRGQWIINKLNHFKPADIPDPADMFKKTK